MLVANVIEAAVELLLALLNATLPTRSGAEVETSELGTG